MAAWDSIPESERPFQRRLMEVFAGFVEHVDIQAGKVIDELDARHARQHHRVLLLGDNGSSAEGQNGSISELLAQNQIPNTIEQQLEALDKIGGLEALGGPKVDNMYHAGWAWAGARRSSIPSWSPRTSAAPAIRWRSLGRRISSRIKLRARSSTTSTTSCPPFMTSSASSRRGSSMALHKTRSTASA